MDINLSVGSVGEIRVADTTWNTVVKFKNFLKHISVKRKLQ